MESLENTFSRLGGEFVSSLSEIRAKLEGIRAFIFDWDGVFNTGTKGDGLFSPFSEADAMATNLLRFGFWLEHQHQLPFVGIITGENNRTAIQLAERECFSAVYFKIPHKGATLEHLQQAFQVSPKEIAFFFDDVLDLPLAKQAGLRFLVRRKAGPLFLDYAKQHGYCDYITAREGGSHAIREVVEMLLGAQQVFDQVVSERLKYSQDYQKYLSERNQKNPIHYSWANNTITKLS